MNRIFKVVWNRLRGQYMVADENCMSHGKGKTVLSLTLSALLAVPGISAADIVGRGGTSVSKVPGSDVYNVTTSRYSGKVGFNQFSKFNLPVKNIANLHHPAGTNHLVNFVSDQITIDGTVNSVLNNKIGGNLYFVTPTGFTVGATGVINAGSVTAAVVKSADFDKWDGKIDNGDYSDWTGNNGALLTAFRKGEVPVNPNGVITVNGSINAGNGITLTASKINVGNGARLKTGVGDFSNLVNIKDGQGNVSVDSGVDGIALVGTADGTGDIILAARSDADGEAFATTADAEVTVSGDAGIEATAIEGAAEKANVKIFANALAGKQDIEYDDKTGEYVLTASRDQYDVQNTITSKVTLGSGTSVYADGSVVVKATSDNTMDGTFIQSLVGDILQYTVWESLPLSRVVTSAAWANLKTKADVVIEEGATVSGDIGVGVESTAKTVVSAEASPGYEMLLNWSWVNKVPMGNAAVGIAQSDSSVTVGGTLKTSGDLVVSAKNNLESTVTSESSLHNTTGNPVVLSLSILEGTSKVDVTDKAVLDMSGGNGLGNLIIGAQQDSDINSKATARNNTGSALAIALDWVQVDTDASVSVNTGVTGKAASVSIFSDNTASQLTLDTTVGNIMPIGVGDLLFDFEEAALSKAIVASILGKSIGQVTGEVADFDKNLKGAAAGSILTYGQHANTAVGSVSGISATESLEVTSTSVLKDHLFKSEGGYEAKPEESMIGSAISVLVTIPSNGGLTAKTDILDGAVLSSDGTIAVSSSVSMPYGRVQKMTDEFWVAVDSCINFYRDFTDEDRKEIEKQRDIAIEKLSAYSDKTEGNPGVSPVASEEEELKDVLASVDDFYGTLDSKVSLIGNDLYQAVLTAVELGLEAANFTNYSNIYAGAGGKITDGKSGWDVSGTFIWNSLRTEASTEIGRGAKLTSVGDLKVQSDEKLENAVLAGYFPKYSNGIFSFVHTPFLEGNQSPIGASVGLQFLEERASVTIREGAELVSTGGNVDVGTETDTLSVGIAGAASKTNGTKTFELMVSGVFDVNESVIDIDDEATIKSAGKDVTLSAAHDSSIQVVSAALAWQSGVEADGAGMAGAAFVDADLTAAITVADNDGDTTVFDKAGLLMAGGTLSAKTDVDTKTNAIGASLAGTSSKSGGAKELKPEWFSRLTEDPHGISYKLSKWIEKGPARITDGINKLTKRGGEAVGANDAGNNLQNPIGDGNVARVGNPVDLGLEFDAAGSVGWNMVDITSSVDVGTLEQNDAGQYLSKTINLEAGNVEIDAVSDHWLGSWAGSAALSLMGDRQNIESGYSVAGTFAMNAGDLVSRVGLARTDIALADQGNLKLGAVSDGKLVSEGLGLAIAQTNGSGHSFDGDVSLNLVSNTVETTADTVTLSGGTHGWQQYAWAGDIQVTGGTLFGFAKGRSSTVAGATIVVAELTNTVSTALKNSDLGELSGLSLEALTSMTQVTTAVSGQVAVASGAEAASIGISGSAGAVIVSNEVKATAENVTADLIAGGTFDIVSESVTSDDAKEEKQIGTGSRQSFFSDEEIKAAGQSGSEEKTAFQERMIALNSGVDGQTDNDGFISDIELKNDTSLEAATDYSVKAGENQKITDLRKAGKLEQVSVVANVASGKNTFGGAVVVEDIDNTFKATASGLKLNESADAAGSALRIMAESQVSSVGVSAGATVSQSSGHLNAGGSVVVSNVSQTSEAGLSGSVARVSDIRVDAENDAVTVNVAGDVGVSLGEASLATAGAAVVVANTENTANAYVSGTSGSTDESIGAKDAANAGMLEIIANNNAQTWGASVEASVTATTAIGGSVTVNRVFQHTDTTLSDTVLNRFTDVSLSSADDSDPWTLAGGVSVSWGGWALNGAVAYTQAGRENDEQEGDVLYNKTGTRANVSNVTLAGGISGDMTVKADNTDALHTLAVSAGISAGLIGFGGSANVNSIYHATGVDISNLLADSENGPGVIGGALVVDATNESSISGLSVTGAASVSVAGIGLATAVNRTQSDTYASLSGSRIASGTSHVSAKSDLDTDMIGVTGQGSAVAGGDGFVAVNLINDNTALSVGSTDISTTGGNVLEALGSSTIGSYAGGASGAAVAAGNLSVSVSERSGDVTADITGSTLSSEGTGPAVTRTTGVNDDDIIAKAYQQDISLQDSLSTKLQTEDTAGVAVGAYSTSTYKTFTVLGSGSGTVAFNGLGSRTVESGQTGLNVSGSTLAAGSADADAKAGGYTNFYTVLSEGVGSGVVSLGFNGEWVTSERDVSATVMTSTLSGNDVTLASENKFGSSGVTVSADGSGGVTGDAAAVITRNTGSASSSLSFSSVNADHDYIQDTYRLSRMSFLTAGLHGSAVAEVAGDAFISYDDGDSFASVAGSSVTAGNDITVGSDRLTDVNTVLVQAGGSRYAAVNGLVAVNTFNTRSATDITGGNTDNPDGGKTVFDAGHDVNILAGGTSRTDFTEVEASVSASYVDATIGVGVTNTYDNSTSSVSVADATITAANDVDVEASLDRFHDQETVFVASSVGKYSGSFNAAFMALNINTAYDAASDPNAGTQIDDYRQQVSTVGAEFVKDDMPSSDGSVPGSALSGDEKNDIIRATSAGVSEPDPALGKTSVDITDSTITGKNVSVRVAEDTADGAGANLESVDADAAIGLGFDIVVNRQTLNHQRNMILNVDRSQLTAQNDLTLLNESSGEYLLKEWSVGVGLIDVSVQQTNNTVTGSSSVSVMNGSVLKGTNVTLTDRDTSYHKAEARSVDVAGFVYMPTSVHVTDSSIQRLGIDQTDLYAQVASLEVDRNHKLRSYMYPILVSGIDAYENEAVSTDNSGSGNWMMLTRSFFDADVFQAGTNYRSDIEAEATRVYVSVVDAVNNKVTAEAKGHNGLWVTGNTFKAEGIIAIASAGLDGQDKNGNDRTLRLKAGQQGDGAGVLLSGGDLTSTAQSDVMVTTTFMDNRIKAMPGKVSPVLSVVSASDVRFDLYGDGGSGGIVPATRYVSDAVNNTNTELTLGGLDTGDVTQLSELFAGSANRSEYSVSTYSFDIGVVACTETSQSNAKDYSSALAKISGNWDSGDDATLFSSLSSVGKLYARSDGGSVAGYSGATITVDVDGTAELNVNQAAISADNVGLFAATVTTLGSTDDGPALDSDYYGLAVAGSGVLKNTVNRKATVTIEDADVTARNALAIGAISKNDIKLDVSTTTGALADGAYATTEQNLTFTNTVDVGNNSDIRMENTDSTARIAAWSEDSVEAKSTSKAEGLFVWGDGLTELHLDRNNTVHFGDGSSLYSAGDIDINAGKGLTGHESSKYVLASELIMNGIDTDVNSKLSGEAKLNDKVLIDTGSDIRAVTDVNIYAGDGNFEMLQESRDIYQDTVETGQDKVPVAVQKETKDRVVIKSDAEIHVDGTVTAGTQNKSDITLRGFVAPDNLSYTLTDSSGNPLTVLPEPLIDVIGVGPKILNTTSESVANAYWERHQNLQQMIVDYQAGPQTDEKRAMVLAYMQEDQFLLNEMLRRGLAQIQPDGSYAPCETAYRTVAELSGITVSGGDISLTTAAVSGSGTLNAQGGEGITINNLSSVALDLSDITILKDGGNLTVNGDDFRTAEAQKIMKDFTGTASGPGGSAETNSINIASRYEGDKTVVAVRPDGSRETVVDNSIIVSGAIDNRAHDVVIYSENDLTIEETGSVHAAGNIDMNTMGDVIQEFSAGMTNIGGDANAPETMYSKTVSEFLEAAKSGSEASGYTVSTDSVDEKYGFDFSGGVVAGGDIYIAGEMINVNGIIQSGYAECIVDVTDSASEQRILDITDTWKAMGSPDITSLKTNTYLVKQGGWYLKDDRSFGYRPDVWYNPSTKTLELSDITATGGHIYLTGQISSTGNSKQNPSTAGRIFAADGPITVDIKAGAHDLALHTVDTGADRVAFIRITDTGYMDDQWDAKVTEYTQGKTTSYMTKVEGAKEKRSDPTETAGYSPYNPKSGLIYGWTQGESVGTTTVKTTEEDNIFWAWTISEETKWSDPVIVREDRSDLASGGTTSVVQRPEGYENKEFVAWFNKKEDSKTVTTETWTEYGFLHFTSTYYAKETTVEEDTYLYSMTAKADYPIPVGMLTGDGTVNVSTGGSLFMSGNITAKNGDVTLSAKNNIEARNDTVSIRDAKSVSMTATEGSIGSDTRSVKLSGSYGASSVAAWTETAAPEADIAAMSADVKRDYDALAASKILTLNASAGQGAYIDGTGWNNRIESGNVTVGTDMKLTAAGDVKVGDVTARNITVSSDKGSVYIGHVNQKEAEDNLQQLNGSARYRYTVGSATGDLSLGQITVASDNSVVTLQADGSIKNGLPREEFSDFTADRKLAMWQEIGLLGENGAYIGDQIRADRESMIGQSAARDYTLYQQLDGDDEKSGWSEQKWQLYGALKDKYGQYATLDAAIKGITDQYLGDDTKLGWTKNELLFAIAESVVHPESSSSEALFMSVPNVTAKTVNLTSNEGQVGTQEDPSVWSYDKIRDNRNNGAFYEAAFMADAGDIVWDKEAKTVTVTVHRPITMASPDTDIQSHLSAETKSDADKAGLTAAYLSDNELIVDKATTEGPLRISTRQGIKTNDDTVVMTGDTVTLHAGEGGIDHVKIDAETWALLTAGKDISVESATEKLALYAVSGGGDVTIKGNEIDSYVDPENPGGLNSAGYVEAAGTIYLDAKNIGIGNGTKEALRLADGSVVEIDSPLNSVYMTSAGSVQVGTEGGTASEMAVEKDDGKAGTGVFSLVSKNAELLSHIKADEDLIVMGLGGSVTADGKLTAGGDIVLKATETLSLKDHVDADGDVGMKAGEIAIDQRTPNAVKVSGDNVTLKQTAGTLDTGNADISADSDLTMLAEAVETDGGKLSSGADMTIGSVTVTDPDVPVTKSVKLNGTDVSAGNDLTVEATDYAGISGNRAVLSGGDMSIYSNGEAVVDAPLKAQGDVSVKTENTDKTKDSIVVLGDIESLGGSVTLESDTIDIIKEPDVSRNLTAKEDVTLKSESSVGLGNTHILSKEGDVLVDTGGVRGLGARITAEEGNVRFVATPHPGEGVFAPTGNVILGDTTVTAKQDLDIVGVHVETLGGQFTSGGDMTVGNVDPDAAGVPVTKTVDMTGTAVNTDGNLTVKATDRVALAEKVPVRSGQDITVYSNGEAVLDADLVAQGNVSVKTENTDKTKDMIVVLGNIESQGGSVTLESDTIDIIKEPGISRNVTAKEDVVMKSESSIGLGNTHILSKEGDVLIDTGGVRSLGARITAEQGSVKFVATPHPGEGVFAPMGNVLLNDTVISAKEELSATGETVVFNNVAADAETMDVSADRGLWLTQSTSLLAESVSLSSAHGNVLQTGVTQGAGIVAEELTVSAPEGSVSLGALPVDDIGGNRVTDMDVTVRDNLNIGVASESLNLGVTQAAEKIGDVTIYNAAGTVSIADDMSGSKDVLVYAAGIDAKDITADELVELSTIGLEHTASVPRSETGVKAGDLKGKRVAVATLTGNIKLGDVRSKTRADIYRNSEYIFGNVSVRSALAGTSLKVLNAHGSIETGNLFAVDKKQSAVIYDFGLVSPMLFGAHGNVQELPLESVTMRNVLQRKMRGLSVADAATIKGAHVDLLSVTPLAKNRHMGLYRSYDLNSPAGYYFWLNIREDISADSVDGLPILHDNMITGEKDFPVIPDIVLAPEADGDVRLEN